MALMSMDISPRLVAVLAFAALLPLAVYTAGTDELTAVTAAIGAVNVVIIAGSLVVLFGSDTEFGRSNGTAG